MATIIKTDGGTEQLELAGPPGNPERLKQLQNAVGGYIELVGRVDSGYVLGNEDGLSKQLPLNANMSRQLGYSIVGNCVVLTEDEWAEEQE